MKSQLKRLIVLSVSLICLVYISSFLYISIAKYKRFGVETYISESSSLKVEALDLSSQQAGPSINEIDPPVGEVNYGLPLRLAIPVINVNTNVEYVGTTNNGEMDVPKYISSVAWYKFGPRPGEIGSSVIVAHYGWKNGKASAFDNLHELKVGDKVYVEDDGGVIIIFVVRDIRKYDWKANTNEVFTSNDGLSHLNLVTCSGVFNKKEGSYSKRLVVFTDKE